MPGATGDEFVLEFDLPGIDPATVDLDVERNVLTIKAERPTLDAKQEVLAAERAPWCVQPAAGAGRQPGPDPGGGRVRQRSACGLRVPVAEQAKPRKIMINSSDQGRQAISA